MVKRGKSVTQWKLSCSWSSFRCPVFAITEASNTRRLPRMVNWRGMECYNNSVVSFPGLSPQGYKANYSEYTICDIKHECGCHALMLPHNIVTYPVYVYSGGLIIVIFFFFFFKKKNFFPFFFFFFL